MENYEKTKLDFNGLDIFVELHDFFNLSLKD